jgi:hypothetical protein
MDPVDGELVRIGRVGRRLPAGMILVGVLVVIAILKPWPGSNPPPRPHPTPSATATQTQAPSARPSLDPNHEALVMLTCARDGGWRVVAADTSPNRIVHSVPVPAVEYSTVPPLRASIPITSLPVTPLPDGGLATLALCVPATLPGTTGSTWSATLWQLGGEPAGSRVWQLVARLDPPPHSLGAIAQPLGSAGRSWQPGLYLLETRFEGTIKEAWLGIEIQFQPNPRGWPQAF